MPVYVTRAHVTLGDSSSRKERHKRSGHIKRPFHITDICGTPYCFRTLGVSLGGFFVVAAGCLMIIIGYKPELLFPGLVPVNRSGNQNVSTTTTSTVSHVTTPSALKSLVYIGPVLMGIGFFSMMMAIVLFCEIKDRYFNNILPKEPTNKPKKEQMYDKIISEFRKNYFRGIEVPLRKPERRKSKRRFSFSLSRSCSSWSSIRRHSQDSQKRKQRKNSRDSSGHSVKSTSSKVKRSAIRRKLDPDSWMKTSSLPNIRHKEDVVELHEIHDIDNNIEFVSRKPTSRSCGPQLGIFQISGNGNGDTGLDNPAYRDSPTDKKKLLNQEPSGEKQENKLVTTVWVHRESKNNDDITLEGSAGDLILPTKETVSSNTSITTNERVPSQNVIPEGSVRTYSEDTVIDIDKDIVMIPCNEDTQSIPNERSSQSVKEGKCVCGTREYCDIHALGMDSDGSSVSLSWDGGIPYEWNDARRNTDPFSTYPCLCRNVSDENGRDTYAVQSRIQQKAVIKSKSSMTCTDSQLSSDREQEISKRGAFRTCIGVFRSESNIPRLGPYTLLRPCQEDNLSLDSLDLTEEMLKNFEMAEMAYI